MFFQIDGAIDMVEKKIDYLRKPWTMPFLKIPFASKSGLYSKLQPWFFQKRPIFQKFCCAACAPRGFFKKFIFTENGPKRALFGSF